jgi:protein-arginine kinase activator protein McsA
MNKSPWEKYKEKLKNNYSTTPLDFLKPSTKYSETELSKKRINICNSCEFLFKPTKQCKKCGCFMPAKVLLEQSKCPIGEW